jgi:predicted nucleic acid-binding protein
MSSPAELVFIDANILVYAYDPDEGARRDAAVAILAKWCSTNTDTQLIVSASMLDERHKLQWWDAIVLEGALRSGATTLLSEDMRHGQRFGLLTVRNPFLEN